jgi:hypothetical protein
MFAERPLCTNLCKRVLKQPADCLVECSIAACFPLLLCFTGTCCRLVDVQLLDSFVYQAAEEAVLALCCVCSCRYLLQVHMLFWYRLLNAGCTGWIPLSCVHGVTASSPSSS